MKKAKKDKKELTASPEDLSPLAHPLAEGKLLKRLYKIVKRGRFKLGHILSDARPKRYLSASKARQVKRGVKEVVKAIRKGERG